MADDVRAAADNVIAYAANVLEEHITPLLADAVSVAIAYLAEHPADDAESVTLSWLREERDAARDLAKARAALVRDARRKLIRDRTDDCG